MNEITMSDVQGAFAAMDVEVETPVARQPRRRERGGGLVTLASSGTDDVTTDTAREPVVRIDGAAEEAEYRAFAEMLGIVDDETPTKYVTMPETEYVALKREADRLPGLMVQRPANVSPEEEHEYQMFLRQIGPV